jgi:hypothetical protein
MLTKINSCHQRGGDAIIRDTTKNPPKVRNMLAKIAPEPITSLQLVRTPLSKATSILLHIATLGQLENKLRESKIDKLFHLSILINGKYNLEKNEVIHLSVGNPITEHSETLLVPPPDGTLTIGDAILNTMAFMGNKYGSYNAVDNNCGNFIDAFLTANGLHNDNSKIFVTQKVEELFTKFPSLSRFITDFATTAGAVFDRQTQGEGI